MDIDKLTETATTIRRDIIKMTTEVNSGHPGGSLSATDIITVLYFKAMRHDPQNPSWPDRDRFILSKGHAAPALYSALAHSGYFPKEQLLTLRKFGSPLQGHPETCKLQRVHALSAGLSPERAIAANLGLAGKIDN